MASVVPFAALRPPAHLAQRVCAPPYDVIDTDEARALAAGNPDSYLRISRPEIDLPEGTDVHADEVYAKGRDNLQEFVAREVLLRDGAPRLYVYAQTMGSHRQVGVVGCASVREYLEDIIKKHEKTRADKEDDRTRHIDTLGAHDEPVFLTYRADADIDAAVQDATRAAPAYDFTTQDGVRHVFWAASAEHTQRLETRFRAVSTLYVADGHHRSAAAARVHALRAGTPGEHDRFMAVVFPHDQMQILAYNRLVRDAEQRSAAALLERLRAIVDLEPSDVPAPDAARSLGVYVGGHWYRARFRDPVDSHNPVASLDCSLVQDRILAPVFGITDPRRDTRVDFVGGIRGAAELERRVARDGFSIALHLFPTTVQQLMAVSDAGLLMPPKSTWFEPKLRSGLFVHTFHE